MGQSEFGKPTKSLLLGSTLRSPADLEQELEHIHLDYRPELYDCLEHNCNTLST